MPPNRRSFNSMINRWKGEHQTYSQAIEGVHSFADVDIPDDPVGQIDAYNQITGELQAPIAGAVANGEPLLYLNSLNNVSLAINQGSFAEKFEIQSGADWNIYLSGSR